MVQQASLPAPAWGGPRTGPPAPQGQRIAIVAEDLRNGGILGVIDGLLEASKVVGWTAKVIDCNGSPAGRTQALIDAMAYQPDGLVLVGTDAKQLNPGLATFARQRIPIVGWHVAARPGPVTGTPVAINVSTDPERVAQITAMTAVVQSGGQAGVVVFTDSNFEVARAKTSAIVEALQACRACTVLEVRDVPISRAAVQVPPVVQELLQRYGARWTHALAINDIYFDYATPALTLGRAGGAPVSLVSAGDGSESALQRIRNGVFQTATVAEPLALQGWQLIDEMNRLLAGQAPTGYVFPVHLVTSANIDQDGGPQLRFDPDNGYRGMFRRLWGRP
ncbi:substrate-binding domain-containing protein [Ideonella dechloratans]|uniref:substrate-binding domain-containing protein n=1 Tax=Ideonella dechloratans TaxID=36863 RepID=UPI0035B1780A